MAGIRLFGVVPALVVTLAGCQQGSLRTTHDTHPVGRSEVAMSPAYLDLESSVSSFVRDQMQHNGIVGLSLALIDGDEIAWAKGFGYADKEAGVTATAETLYRVGSIAKPFTAMAVMQLAEDDVVDIDQPLSAYLPGFRIKKRFTQAQPITLRQIMNHHSGLPGSLTKGMWSNDRFTTVTKAIKKEYPAYPPDFIFGYSNVGYSLLGNMIEVQSEQRFEDYMQSWIFDSLGMHSTGYTDQVRSRSTLATAYSHDGPETLLPMRDLPAMGLHTNVLDLARFTTALLGNDDEVIDPDTVEEMFEVQNEDVALDLDMEMGLGWFLNQSMVKNGGQVLSHGGTTLYYSAQLALLPEHDLAVVVMANTSGSKIAVRRIADALLAKALYAKTGIEQPKRTILAGQPAVGDAVDFPQNEPEEGNLKGKFATSFGLVNIDSDKGEMCACLEGKSFDTVALPHGAMEVKERSDEPVSGVLKNLSRLKFTTAHISGREVMLAHLGERTEIVGEKAPDEPIPPGWIARVGHYQVSNPDPGYPITDIQVLDETGSLCLTYRMPRLSPHSIRVPLQPVSASQAVILGVGRDRGEVLKIEYKDGEERLSFSGYQLRQVRPE